MRNGTEVNWFTLDLATIFEGRGARPAANVK